MAAYRLGRCLLKDLLDQRGLTPVRFSEISGIDKSRISKYINNKQQMELLTAMIISKILGCNVLDLYELIPIE